MVVGWGQECNGCNLGTTGFWNLFPDWSECEEWVSNTDNCNQSDLDVLQVIVDNNDSLNSYLYNTDFFSLISEITSCCHSSNLLSPFDQKFRGGNK